MPSKALEPSKWQRHFEGWYKESQTGILIKIYNVRLRLLHLTIDLYIYSFQLFAIKLEPVNFSTVLRSNTVEKFIELCLIVNSYKEWVLNLSDCFYKSICKANYIALPRAKVKSLI
ncbi:hypothetical protein [Pseudanabaena sp. lw0831]|uniref:hypothetical protein n=1 Tax=Pseudanabaena sp. lw0831 TaxID=1357935 RepID=UPI0019158244|nr:hypothetical protein [Pseudanabaena sp. lw0831]